MKEPMNELTPAELNAVIECLERMDIDLSEPGNNIVASAWHKLIKLSPYYS